LPSLLPAVLVDRSLQAYGLSLLVATEACIVVLRLASSRTGRAWAAVRENDQAAESVGVNAPRAKLLAFAMGAGCAGIAGALYAGLLSYIEPGLFDLTVSLMVLAAVVIGGRWGLAGVVLGALTVGAYDRVLADALTSALHGLGRLPGADMLAAADLHGSSYALFGLALYAAILLRASFSQARAPKLTPRAAATGARPKQSRLIG
jgi:branched-chain amino acid transport system permease protein